MSTALCFRVVPRLVLVLAVAATASGSALRVDFGPSPLASVLARVKSAPQKAPTGTEAIALMVPRPYARPGERWIEAQLLVAPRPQAEGEPRVAVRLYEIGGERQLAGASAAATRPSGRVFIDLRSLGMSDARVVALLLDAGGRRLAAVEAIVSARACPRPLAPGQRIPIRIDAARAGMATRWPVTFGVPFHEGALWNPTRLRLVDGDGRERPCQKEVVALWAPEGAVKWVRFDAIVSAGEGCFVEVREPRAAKTQLVVEERGDEVVISTGPARFVLAKGASPIREVWLAGRSVAVSEGARGLYVVDQRGRVASASAHGETMTVEARGPVAACVRFEGDYRCADGTRLARHITRVEAFAGEPFAKITHTLVLTEDTNEVWFKDIGWELTVDAGAGAHAAFGLSRDKAEESKSVALPEGACAYMIQDEHLFFDHGRNHFAVAMEDGGKRQVLHEGEECGDWFALVGDRGGLLAACRDAARQHPKEFDARAGKLVLHLFSSRGGEELDFRTETLVKRWDLVAWYKKRIGENNPKVGEYVERVRQYDSNAAGWAKTHELLFCPVASNAELPQAVRYSALHSRPTYAITDPAWICSTEAMGAIHPRDPERFPILERVIDRAIAQEIAALDRWGDFGFVDYYAGPHYQTGNPRRYLLTYTLRGDLWLCYARSGDRRIREFIATCDRSYMDNRFAHWGAAGRVRGLLHSAGGESWEGYGKDALPFYWEGVPRLETSSTTNLHNFIWLYYLTGYRRAKDVVLEYADGVKRYWTPKRADETWRQLMAMRLLVQAYGFTWDPELLAMADVTTDTFVDADGEVGLTKNRPYQSSTYKTQVDVAALLDAWEITGDPRYYELSMKVSQHWWRTLLGQPPISYCNPQGRIGSFLYRETGEPRYAQGLAVQLRQAATLYDPDEDATTGYGRSAGTFIFQGVPFAQAAVVAAGAVTQTIASWAGFDDFGYPASIVVEKKDDESVVVDVRHQPERSGDAGAAGGIRVRPLVPGRVSGQEFNSVLETSGRVGTVRIPKDSRGGSYEIALPSQGRCFALARSKSPMVVYAPEYWLPQPTMAPPARWYFNVPEGSQDGQVFFEAPARLLDPKGQATNDGKPVSGWVDLPAGKPGLWSFEPQLNRLVRVRNLPPFFATGDPACYFEPEIAWPRLPRAEEEPAPAADAVFVPGAIQGKGNQALHLAGKRSFVLPAGEPHPSGNGAAFVPGAQGTIEFWFRPDWSTFSLPGDATKRLLTLDTDGPQRTLSYLKRVKPNFRYPTHNLYGVFYMPGPTKALRTPAYRKTVFEAGQWVHVAWVWGMRDASTHRGAAKLLFTQIFVAGRPGTAYVFRRDKPPATMPKALRFGPAFDGAIDELRVSDVQRYTGPFEPPTRERELKVDEHTRSLFHFDRTAQGERGQPGMPPFGQIEP